MIWLCNIFQRKTNQKDSTDFQQIQNFAIFVKVVGNFGRSDDDI